jgi:hypothetical protein
MTVISTMQRVITATLNFNGLFFVATLVDKMNSALCLRLSTNCFMRSENYLLGEITGGDDTGLHQKKYQIEEY